jgi:hypothetical protein
MHEVIASNIMSRTTIDIDKTVLEQLRERAAAERKSMGQVATEVLAAGLRAGQGSARDLPPLRWPKKSLGSPRVDLEDKDAVWRLLDRESLAGGAS